MAYKTSSKTINVSRELTIWLTNLKLWKSFVNELNTQACPYLESKWVNTTIKKTMSTKEHITQTQKDMNEKRKKNHLFMWSSYRQQHMKATNNMALKCQIIPFTQIFFVKSVLPFPKEALINHKSLTLTFRKTSLPYWS